MDIDNIIDCFRFSEILQRDLDNLIAIKPFHINVIDELHINENGHSRILSKLLQYRTKRGNYELLESFLSFIGEKYIRDEKEIPLKKIKIENPIITQELERIDLWVREKGKYAIIFENKVCGASDQEAQIFRYIEKTKKLDFTDEQIYIIYLPPTKEGELSDNSWNKEEADYYKRYDKRYYKVPYKEYIIPWLEEDVLPNIRLKDELLLSAIKQYIDYLKGYFQIRNTNNMKNEEQQILNKILELENKDKKEKVKELEEKIQKLQNSLNFLSQYRDDINREIFLEKKEEWKKRIDNDFGSDFEYCDFGYGGVYIQLDGIKYKVYVNTDSRWYCQLEFDENTYEKDRIINNDSIKNSGVRGILNLPQNFQGDRIWKYLGYDEETKSYECLKEVLQKVKDYNMKNK